MTPGGEGTQTTTESTDRDSQTAAEEAVRQRFKIYDCTEINLTESQLKIAYSGQTEYEKEGDRLAFVNALDGLVDYVENYDALLESVSQFYVKFDIKTAKPLHKIALKKPEMLSDKERLLFFDHSFLILQNIR